MESGEDKPRHGFINRYWVLIVIVLWLIAWSARDWLAPAEPEDPPAESGVVLEEESPAVDEEAAREEAAREEAAREEAAREEAAREEAAREEAAREEAAREEAAREEAVREEAVREEAVREEAVEEPVEVEALLTEARETYWREGAAAALTVLEGGLETQAYESRERADILGELGNLQYATGDVEAAMGSWDRALEKLPEGERRAMMAPLRPIYARHHPQGADHLERFR
ncbi:hypothetical protein [Thioalkalivibrio sp. ALE11]|uniref:hypothetical protein n=1 Tax=Thioalkalivibrio sp. ALE11 TaxID=1265494 RepID=UPI000362D9B2|nr:hypothetical protein [Thioalkalivibrio sp. ALE11]